MITDDKEKTEVLNACFSSISPQKIVYDLPGKCEVQKEGTGLPLEIDKQIVKGYLTTLNESKSLGPDKQHPRICIEGIGSVTVL